MNTKNKTIKASCMLTCTTPGNSKKIVSSTSMPPRALGSAPPKAKQALRLVNAASPCKSVEAKHVTTKNVTSNKKSKKKNNKNIPKKKKKRAIKRK